MIGLNALYIVTGLMFAAFAAMHVRHRRWRKALFWGAFSATLLFGSVLPDLSIGALVIVMAAASIGLKPASAVASPDETHLETQRVGNWLFLPALIVPMVTLAGSLLMPDGKLAGIVLIAPKQVTLTCLVLGAVIALGVALLMTRTAPKHVLPEGQKLADQIGWALVLPQMLAALGGFFALAGVGDVIARLIVSHIGVSQAWMAAALYCVGMAGFTFIMGNAFAAFPVMTAGIGLPLIVRHFGGDPNVMCAVGMLSGFCGTLITPMAANFNLVPAAVLNLKDRYAVIKVQAPTAFGLLICNILIMSLFGFTK